jgi:hypothetical protein
MEQRPEEEIPKDGQSPIAETLDKMCEEMKNLLASAERLLQPDADDPVPEASDVEGA